MAEQLRIADFLDDQVTRIDRTTAARQQQVSLLMEYLSALVIQMTSRGAVVPDPARDSGLPWCPIIQADWPIIPTRAALTVKQELVGEAWADHVLLSLTKRGVIRRDVESNEGKFPASFETYQIVLPGDLVFCLFDVDETPRTVGLVGEPGMVTGAYTRFVVNTRLSSPEYLLEYFTGIDDRKAFRPLYTGMRKTIQKDRFLAAGLPLPSLDQQSQIIRFLDGQRSTINGLIGALTRSVTMLGDLKRSLISAAISGEFDVSSASGRGVPS